MSEHDLDVVSNRAEDGGRRAMVGIYYFEDDADGEE